jgi:hypothetical protein
MKVVSVAKKDVRDAVEGAMGGEVNDFRAVDITFYTDGEEVQPKKDVSVKLTTSAFDTSEDLSVVHVEGNGGEVMDLTKATDTTAQFKTDGFSIYVVVDTGEDARLTVNFVQADGTTTVEEKINQRQIDKIDQYIYDPGVGTLPEGTIFGGWTQEQNYTSETEAKTIAGVREEVIAELNKAGGIHDGDSLTFYAMVFKPYTVTYLDERSIMVKTDQILVRNGAAAPQYTVTEDYTPYPTGEEGVVAQFMGWQQLVPAVTGEKIYKPGTEGATFTLEAAEYTLIAVTARPFQFQIFTFSEQVFQALFGIFPFLHHLPDR